MTKRRINRKIISVLIVLALSLVGCNKIEFSIDGKVSPPNHKTNALNGTWKVEKYVLKENKSTDTKKYIGKIATFDQSISIFGDERCVDPAYKIIHVKTNDFLQKKYKIHASDLGITTEEIDVITVTSNHQIFYDFIKKDDHTLIGYVDGGFAYLHKISDKVEREDTNETILKDYSGKRLDHEKMDDPLLRSGVLLGIRSADNSYHTLWIQSQNKQIKSVLYREQLLVPRIKGFWEVGVNKLGNESSLYATPLTENMKPVESLKDRKILNENGERKILFIGNDYVGTEYNGSLQVLPIDQVGSAKGIKLRDITNDHADQTLLRSSEAFISSLERKKSQRIKHNPTEDEFTLERRNGHWMLKGRLHYEDAPTGKGYEDFDVSIIVPSKLINYDEMPISWGEIKATLPWVTDAFVSPSNDLGILVASNDLYIYSLKAGNIYKKPLQKIALKDGDSVVMAEWAVGEFVDKWAKFVGLGFKPVE